LDNSYHWAVNHLDQAPSTEGQHSWDQAFRDVPFYSSLNSLIQLVRAGCVAPPSWSS